MTIESIFKQTLEREKKILFTEDGQEIKGFFRRSPDSKDGDSFVTFFTADTIQKGDILSNIWIVLTQENSNEETTVYKKYLLQRINYTITFNFLGEYIPLKTVVDTSKTSLSYKDIVEVKSTIYVRLKDFDSSRKIKINQRFICIGGQPYKVIDISFIDGFCNIQGVRDLINEFDDVENEIADRWRYEPKPIPPVIVYSVSPTNVTFKDIDVGETQVFDCEKTSDGMSVKSIWTCVGSGLDSSFYTIDKISDTRFVLTCLKGSETQLKLTFKCETFTSVYNIDLKTPVLIPTYQVEPASGVVTAVTEESEQIFNCKKFEGITEVASTWTCVGSGISNPTTHYLISTTNNKDFTLLNKSQSSDPLTLTFTCEGFTDTRTFFLTLW